MKNVVKTSIEKLGEYSKQTSSHFIYHCPYCLGIRGKSDRKGKLYVHKIKRVGFCFLCEVVVIAQEFLSEEEEVIWARQIFDHVEDVENYEELPFQFRLQHWTEEVEDGEYKEYLHNRGFTKYTVMRYKFLGIKEGFGKGIVIPNKLAGYMTDFFQVRNLGEYKEKYDSLSSEKPLMYSHLIDTEDIAIAEGGFSAASIFQASRGFISPVALLGKSLTNRQFQDLQKVVSTTPINTIYIILDGGYLKEAYQMAWKIKKGIYGVSNVKVVKLPYDQDPNDLLGRGLMGFIDSAKELEKDYFEYKQRSA